MGCNWSKCQILQLSASGGDIPLNLTLCYIKIGYDKYSYEHLTIDVTYPSNEENMF
jgi:hypothetical protein